MANVPTQLSPGVNITEIDLSGIVRETANNITGFVGQFRWGPVSESLLIDSERRLTDIFLNPTNNLPEKMQDDFFNAANFFRYSDKLKIVRVVHEDARNARASQQSGAQPEQILIHNDEEFFAKADPTGIGAKNYSAVLPNANWIARYPGDIGNSIQVRAIGAGTFVQGSVDNPAGGGGGPGGGGGGGPGGGGGGGPGGGGGGIPPTFPNYSLPLIANGQLLEGVTYAVVTIPQITEIGFPFWGIGAYSGLSLASQFIGPGVSWGQAGGNTFGVKYLCFYLKGSSYCNNQNTFPIPGGSYSYIVGSDAADGLSYSQYYRNRWFYGTFGNGDDETDGSNWTDSGPLLAARNMLGLTLQGTFDDENYIWHRDHTFGKGFHQASGVHGIFSGVASKAMVRRDSLGFISGEQFAIYPRVCNIASIHEVGKAYSNGWWFGNPGNLVGFGNGEQALYAKNPWCLEVTNTYDDPWLMKPFTTVSNLHEVDTGPTVPTLSFPSFMVLPFDNSTAAATEPYTNEFVVSGKTYRETSTINEIASAGLTITRTADAYRNIGLGRVAFRAGSTGAVPATDLASTPLRPVIDAFSGITAANNKGMLLLFAFAQQIVGMTSGLLSTWHVGITTNSPFYTGNNLGIAQGIQVPIANVDGNNPNNTTVATSTNILAPLAPTDSHNQLIFGFEAEFDASFKQDISTFDADNDLGVINIISGLTIANYPFAYSSDPTPEYGGQAIPILQNEIPLIKDLVIKKQISP